MADIPKENAGVNRVPIWCMYGNHIWFTDSIDDLVTLMRSFSRFVAKVDPSITALQEKVAREKHKENTIAPSRSELRRVLKRHGYLTVACLDCNALVSQAAYARLGRMTVKVGVTLVAPELLECGRMFIETKRK